jgi:enterochelin esterase-like enzyme
MPVPDQKPLVTLPATRIPAQTSTPAPDLTDTPVSSPAPTLAPAVLSTPMPACVERQGRLSVLYLDSATLGRRIAYSIYLPPCYTADPARVYPVLYLLHGANADHTQWPDLNVAANADSLIALRRVHPFVVVMPDGDYRPGEDYAAFVLHDLIPQIEQTVHSDRDRKSRAIGGLSRGGAWALEIALTHPEQFSAVGGHSPVSDTAMKHVSPAALGAVRIYLDVGKDDPLASGVEAFAGQLELEGFAPTFHLYPGGHDRPYWRSHTAEYLAFYAAAW